MPEKYDLTRAIGRANLRAIPSSLWEELDSHLDHNPAFGLALARVLHTLAKRGRNLPTRARADLALIRALNVCGEFYQAAQLCAAAARRFEKIGNTENIARVWLEAAWAETYLGNLENAEKQLEHATRARAPLPLEEELGARGDWIRARIFRERGNYQAALELFATVRAFYAGQRNKLAAMHVLREMGHTHARVNPSAALKPLKTARAFFVETQRPMQIALCDYWLAQALMDLNRFEKAQAHLARAQKIFQAQHSLFFDGYCDLEFGYLCWFRDQHSAMLEYSQRAYTLFLELNALQEIASCEINIGVALTELNRFAKAIPFLESGVEHSLKSGRTTKAAVCLLNLGDIALKQGQPSRALEQLLRARAILVDAQNMERIVACDLRLGKVYLQVAAYQQALAAIERAHILAKREKMTTRLAQCELYRAQVFLLCRQSRKAAVALRHARTCFARNNQTSHVALCERLLAEIPSPHRTTALARLTASRAIFQQQRNFVEVALCDLTRGELCLRWCDWDEASKALSQAQRVLQESFPDQNARILYGLGRIAQAHNQPQRALQHFVQAAQTLAQVRRSLSLESLSNSFFGARQRVVHDGLKLARRVYAPEAALTLMEAAKAQTFSQLLATQAWRMPQTDTRTRALEQRAHELREQIEHAHEKLAVRTDTDAIEATRSRTRGNAYTARLRALQTLRAEYERIAQELRLARTNFAGVPELDPFSLEAFRAAASKRWGSAWLALDYFFDRAWLYIVSVNCAEVHLHAQRWGWQEKELLEQATQLHPDMRELILNGTLRGEPMQQQNPMRHLGELLLPPQAQKISSGTLLITPHQRLHQLPFQALQIHGECLAARVNVGYTPTLQAFTQVCEHVPSRSANKLLVCGVENFDSKLPALKHTRREVRQIRRQNPDATLLWQNQVTRERLREWNHTGQLRAFSHLHFATHATVHTDTPHLSAVQLGKGELTALDITNLNLNARLVTLSACSSNIGQGGSGDEWVSLARAFFYAGARALVASLWQVDDESTTKLMDVFYKGLSKGETISEALRSAQLELIRAGATPYQWAAFVAIGDV